MVMGSNPLRLRSGFDSVDGVTTIICFYLIVYISCFLCLVHFRHRVSVESVEFIDII